MEQKKYQALFYGELKEGHSKEMAIRALAGAYHKEDDFFDAWFSGEKTVVKKEGSLEEVEYVRDYLGDLGLVIQIEPLTFMNESADQIEKDTEALLEDAVSKIQQTLRDVQADQASVIVKIQPATMPKRLIAYILDLIICMIAANLLVEFILVPLGLINVALFHELTSSVNNAVTQDDIRNIVDSYMMNDDFVSLMMQMLFFMFAVQILYFGLMDSQYRGTLGKKLFKIKVYSLVSPKLLFRQAALRQTFMIVAFVLLTMFLNVIGLLVLLGIFIRGAYDKRGLNQTIFDRLTATVVGIDQDKR